MYQLLISLLISLGIIVSAAQFEQMTPEQQQQLQKEFIIIVDEGI